MNANGDNQWQDGDTSIKGVDMRNVPNALNLGIASAGRNLRCRFGKAETRGGIVKFATIQPSYSATWPATWSIVWTPALSVAMQGGEVFDDANGERWVITVANGFVYKSRPGEAATQVPVEGQVAIVGDVFLLQCFDSMLMFRSGGQAELVMEDVDYGFHAIRQTLTGTGTIQIPAADNGEFIQNRVVVPHDRDQYAISDIGDYTRYLPTFNQLRINEGSGDENVRVFALGETSALFFKKRSIIQVQNFSGDLSSITASELTGEYGLVARKAVVGIGRDVWFLSQRGIDSIGLTAQNKIQPGNEPVSGPIQPLIDRINKKAVSKAVAAYFDNKAYFAFPIDDSATNNCVAVYDFVTQSWNGYDDGDALTSVRDFFIFEFAGKERLFFFDDNGFVNLYEEGDADDVWNGSSITRTGIEFDLTTRGYCGGSNGRKSFKTAAVRASTRNPNLSISATFNGSARTVSCVANRTRSRSNYYKFGVPPFVASNASADHATPQRQDYSMLFAAPGVYLMGSNGLGAGIVLDQLADSTTTVKLRGEGQYAQLRVTCSQGKMVLESAEVVATSGKKAAGIEA